MHAGEKVLPILVLLLEFGVLDLDTCLLLLKKLDLVFEEVHLLSLLLAASHGAFSVLEAFPSFLVLSCIVLVIVDSVLILNGLLHVLRLLLGNLTVG